MRKKLYQIAMRKVGFIPPAAAALHWKKIDIGFETGDRNPDTAEGNQMPTVTEEDVLSALRSCYDPEIPVNIVDLGLIYGMNFAPVPAESPEETKQDVTIDMTLTAQGCPEHVNISAQVKSRLEQLPGIRNAAVNVVWSPPWTPERLSPDARKQLGIE